MEPMEPMERMERRMERLAAHEDGSADDRPRDPREESGSRWGLWQRLKTAISSEHPAVSAPAKETSSSSATPSASSAASPSAGTPCSLDHDRARQLLIAQRTTLLPAADANALSAHLLTCDGCYRFAQDLAARHRP